VGSGFLETKSINISQTPLKTRDQSDIQKGEVRMAESGKGGNEEASEPEQDQDGLSAHSPFQAPRSSASSLPKVISLLTYTEYSHSYFAYLGLVCFLQLSWQELPQVELELRLLEGLEIYHPVKLQGYYASKPVIFFIKRNLSL
jgi:hypothetical protein